MRTVNRRRFMQLGGLGAGALGLTVPAAPGLAAQSTARDRSETAAIVRLSGDGLSLTPAQTVRLLSQLADQQPIAPDAYSIGGVVEELEREFARALGKERAVFMPSGTLANHLAVRALAGGPSRVIVQEESHLYRDEGDCAQTLSNLTLVPLARGRATMTAAEVEQEIEQTRSGRVASRVSAISIETPVRRRRGERFDAGELQKVIAVARREGLGLHLDGARLFLQAAYTREDVAALAKPFDTVYVSLYKYFNAPAGAILAGPRSILDEMHHVRRMCGGGLYNVWPFAAIARHYFGGFGDRYAQAVRTSEELIRSLRSHDRAVIERIPSGTNLFLLRVRGDAGAVRTRLADSNVLLAPPQQDTFLVAVNETLASIPAAQLNEAFARALG